MTTKEAMQGVSAKKRAIQSIVCGCLLYTSMEAESPDGEDGFPGNLKLAVRHTLTEDNTFRMDYRVS